ncbi:MAG: OmpA family protein [Spirochaetales bacterium]|nr:OmpA family protein [Spirochaetales bacterium]
MKRNILGITVLCFGLLFLGCGTTPQEPEPTAEPEAEPTPANLGAAKFDTSAISASIRAISPGFSPNGDGVVDTIEFEIAASQTDKLQSWKVEMTHSARGAQKTFSGNGAPPESLLWDGKKNGGLADEGVYTGVLTLNYINGNKPVSENSGKFTLDNTPPQPRIEANPLPFSPDGDGRNDMLTISFSSDDISGTESWKIEIYNEENELFKTFTGMAIPSGGVTWDGIGDDSTIVDIATDYRAKITMTDACNNTGSSETKIPVDVLLERTKDGRYRIKIWAVVFNAYEADYSRVDSDKVKMNKKTIRTITRLLKRYPDYRLQIEGHALMPKSKINDKKAAEAENTNVLIPLTKKRAEAIKKELVDEGCDPSKIETIGHGATYPLVPHNDMVNRWKNRRVEFYLVRD